METIEYRLPEFWATYLFYGDECGLEPKEALQIEGFLAGEGLFSGPLSVSDSPEFCHYHDATNYGILPCNCLTYTFKANK